MWPGLAHEAQVAVYDIDGDEMRVLLPGSAPRFAGSGHLLFVREGSLWAAPFDPVNLAVLGEPREVVEEVWVNDFGWAYYSVAYNGTLLYRPADVGTGTQDRSLVLRRSTR